MRVTRIVIAATAGGILALAAAAPALADQTTRPLRDTVHISHNVDSGHHGYWAVLDYDRTTTIKAAGDGVWNVTVVDDGTFSTLEGESNSPRQGLPVAAADGTFHGTFRFTVASATAPSADTVDASYDYQCDVSGSGNRGTDCPGMPAGTSAWPSLYFGDGAQVTAGTYKWTYTTECGGTWVDAAGNRDGQAKSAGDVTGAACPTESPTDEPTDGPTGQPTDGPTGEPTDSTSPSSSSSPSESSSASPTTSVVLAGNGGDDGLPVTGAPLAAIGGLGALVLGGGLALVLLARRRRRLNS